MHRYHQPESFFNRALRGVETGLKVFGTVKGLYDIGSTIATGARAVASGVRTIQPILPLL